MKGLCRWAILTLAEDIAEPQVKEPRCPNVRLSASVSQPRGDVCRHQRQGLTRDSLTESFVRLCSASTMTLQRSSLSPRPTFTR